MRPPNLLLFGYPSRTLSYTCTAVPQSIPAAELIFEGKPVIAMLFSCEFNSARFTFGDSDPDPVTFVGHMIYPGYTLEFIESSKAIRTFQFCDAAVGQQLHSRMHITLFFEKQ